MPTSSAPHLTPIAASATRHAPLTHLPNPEDSPPTSVTSNRYPTSRPVRLESPITTAVQFTSDLHLERIKHEYTITKSAPVLILAGDIGRFCDYDRYRDFLSKQCADLVLLVAGNHEFYGSSREEGLESADKLMKEPCTGGKLRFLNRKRVDIPGTTATILGCTLHSYIAPDYTKLTNDFERIKSWSVKCHNTEHETDLAWLKDILKELKCEQPKRQVMIVSHYVPLFERSCHPKNENNAVSQCFSSNALADLRGLSLMSSGTHWIFGHTHWSVRMKQSKVIILSNQLCSDDKNMTWLQKKRLYKTFDPKATIRLTDH